MRGHSPITVELVPLTVSGDIDSDGPLTSTSPRSCAPPPKRVGSQSRKAPKEKVLDILTQQLRDAERRVRRGEDGEAGILLPKDTEFFRSRLVLNRLYRLSNYSENGIAVVCVLSLTLAALICEAEAMYCDKLSCKQFDEGVSTDNATPQTVGFAIQMIKVVILVLSVGAAVLNLARYHLQLRIKVLRFMVPRNQGLASLCTSPLDITWLALSTLALLFHVPPGVEFNLLMHTTSSCGDDDGTIAPFWISGNVFNMFMIVRTLPPLFLVMRNICIRHSSQRLAASIGSIHGVDSTSLSFSFRMLFRENPVSTVIPVAIAVITLTSLGLIFVERAVGKPSDPLDFRYGQTGKDTLITNWGDSIWIVIMSISTIGYGAVYPCTNVGRVVLTVGGIAGGVIVVTMVTAIFLKLTNLKYREQKVCRVVTLERWNKEFSEAFAIAVQRAMRRKWHRIHIAEVKRIRMRQHTDTLRKHEKALMTARRAYKEKMRVKMAARVEKLRLQRMRKQDREAAAAEAKALKEQSKRESDVEIESAFHFSETQLSYRAKAKGLTVVPEPYNRSKKIEIISSPREFLIQLMHDEAWLKMTPDLSPEEQVRKADRAWRALTLNERETWSSNLAVGRAIRTARKAAAQAEIFARVAEAFRSRAFALYVYHPYFVKAWSWGGGLAEDAEEYSERHQADHVSELNGERTFTNISPTGRKKKGRRRSSVHKNLEALPSLFQKIMRPDDSPTKRMSDAANAAKKRVTLVELKASADIAYSHQKLPIMPLHTTLVHLMCSGPIVGKGLYTATTNLKRIRTCEPDDVDLESMPNYLLYMANTIKDVAAKVQCINTGLSASSDFYVSMHQSESEEMAKLKKVNL